MRVRCHDLRLGTARVLVAYCGLWFFSCVQLASARAQAPATIVFLHPHDNELVARVQGQTQDLPLQLRIEEATSVAGDVEQRARMLAREQAARAVVWLQARVDGGYDIFVLDAVDDRVHKREVPAAISGHDALAGSAKLEAIALVVRAELLALVRPLDPATGTTADVDARAPPAGGAQFVVGTAKTNKAGPAAVSVSAAEDVDRSASTSASTPALRFVLTAGWELVHASSAYLAQGPAVRLGVGSSRWQLGIAGAFGLTTELVDARSVVHLRRHALALFASARVWNRGSFYLHAGLQLGAVLFDRETVARAATLTISPPSHLMSGSVGAEFRLVFAPMRNLGFALGLGVDAVPWAPRYVYALGSARNERAHSDFLQPRAVLQLVALF